LRPLPGNDANSSQKMSIDYNHSENLHTFSGPKAALPIIFSNATPQSLLDIGCGIGTWLKAAQEAGIADVFGVDGIAIAPQNFLVSKTFFKQQDFTQPWSLGRRFDAALCLEVAEHLDEPFAGNLIETLVSHSDLIVFGAASPHQTGQHHVNCQWPAYWQKLFNERGFVCTDDVRWKIWDDERIEPWYRQNIFTARRNPSVAGQEPRISAAVHPVMLQIMLQEHFHQNARDIGAGAMPYKWYLEVIGKFK
jgi:SAM-dependent methyltransferase